MPGEPTLLDVHTVLGTESELVKAISLARFSATLQAGHGADWVSNLYHVLEAIDAAVTGILSSKTGSWMGPAPKGEASEKFIASIRDLSLLFLRSERVPSLSKHTDKKSFRDSLLAFMSAPTLATQYGAPDYMTVADIILTGSLVFPEIATDRALLAINLYVSLGQSFLLTVADPIERVREVLIAAGVKRKSVWNLLEGAEAQRKSRADRSGEPSKPPRAKRKRSV